MSVSDRALLEKWVAEQDAEAFRELVTRYSGMVYGTCKRILGNPSDAEEVAQECFEQVVVLKQFPGPYFGAWLHRVATNRSLNRMKWERRRVMRESRYSETNGSQPKVTWNDVQDYVDEAIDDLPEKIRVVIVAHFLHNETHNSIGERLGIPRRTVTYRIHNGIERIRKHLKRRGILTSAAVLSVLISSNAVEAAPLGLATALGRLALAGPKVAAPGSYAGTTLGANTVGKGLLMMGMTKSAMIVMAAAVGVVVAAGIWAVSRSGDTEDMVTLQTSAEPAEQDDSGQRPVVLTGLLRGVTEAKEMTESGRTISGLVTDQVGGPIEKARIGIRDTDYETITDGSGQYALMGLSGGEHYIVASKTGYCAAYHTIMLDATAKVDFVLKKSGVVEGVVIGADTGLPLPEFEIGYVLGDFPYMPPDDVPTKLQLVENPEGRFRIDGICVDRITLIGRAPGYGKTTAPLINYRPSETITDLVFALEVGRIVRGTVVDPEGNLLAEAAVFVGALHSGARQNQTRTDENGEFRLDNVPRTASRISAYHKNFAPGSAEITVDNADVDGVLIAMGHGGTVRGMVSVAGRPQVHNRVRMKQHNFTWLSAETNEDGTYQFSGVVPGEAELRVDSPWGGTKIVNAYVTEGETTVVDLDFPAGWGTVEGRVWVNSEVPSSARVRLRVFTETGDERFFEQVRPDGTYSITDVPVGPAQLSVTLGHDIALEYNRFVDLEIKPGIVTRHDFDLVRNVSISGVVSGERYHAYDRVYILYGDVPIPRPITLIAFREFEQLLVRQFEVGESGLYRGENLEPGLYTIVAASFPEESPEGLATIHLSQAILAEFEPGTAYELDLELK